MQHARAGLAERTNGRCRAEPSGPRLCIVIELAPTKSTGAGEFRPRNSEGIPPDPPESLGDPAIGVGRGAAEPLLDITSTRTASRGRPGAGAYGLRSMAALRLPSMCMGTDSWLCAIFHTPPALRRHKVLRNQTSDSESSVRLPVMWMRQ